METAVVVWATYVLLLCSGQIWTASYYWKRDSRLWRGEKIPAWETLARICICFRVNLKNVMNFSDLLQRTNQMLDQVTPAMKVIERVAGMAKNLQEFRDMLSEQARSGGLDEIYNKLKKLEEDRNEYIEKG